MPSLSLVADGAPISLNYPPEGFRLGARCLYAERITRDGEIELQRLCGWISVIGVTHDVHGREYGRVVEFITIDNRRLRRVIRASDIVGARSRVIRNLIDEGFDVELTGQQGLAKCLYKWRPAARFTITHRRGWLAGTEAFVLPDGVTKGSENVIYTGPDDFRAPPARGTLEGWSDEIAARARGNPLLMVAISTAFAGPLVELLGLENGMLHFRGGSSSGKSTLLAAAASIWWGPEGVRRWRATDNGLEGTAERANSMLLCLDELAEVDGRAADAAIYMLGNGQGKARSKSNGQLGQAAHWQLMMLSSGEISLRQKLQEAGRTAQAGQAVRALDIEADQQTFGAFDDLHDCEDGRVFSDALRDAAAAHYGHADPAFVAAVLNEPKRARLKARQLMERSIQKAEERHPRTGSGVPGRARKRFALIAAAGELSTHYHISNWNKGDAMEAALETFGLWLENRGQHHDRLEEQAVLRVQVFLFENRDRIHDLDTAQSIPEPSAYAKGDHIFLPTQIWEHIHDGECPKRAAQALQRRGLLEFGDGRNIKARMPQGVTGESRGYKLRRRILDDVVSDMSETSEGADKKQ
ncbi:DUF927 domain-containing protein [Roseovarius sp. SYSU LYC5161]|uniref:DUF927 domain-containing protein n=1 Tax=Roseovarius halophilus (ex Wu et al. 2025) TaxID=3376060 RepID=UPI00399A5511